VTADDINPGGQPAKTARSIQVPAPEGGSTWV
jgi:hypothetical protein